MKTRPQPSFVVLYDGACPFCTKQAARLASWRAAGAPIAARDFQADGALDDFPGLTHDACMAAMQLVAPDGRVFAGAEAVARLVMTRPILGLLAWLYYVPLVRALFERAYRFVAVRRYRLARRRRTVHCDGTTCSVHFS